MNLFVSHISALRYWRREEGLGTSEPAPIDSLADAVASTKDAKQLLAKKHDLPQTAAHPLHVLLPTKASRRYAKSLIPHVWRTELPADAFRQVAPHLFVSSPEFVFVQMASKLTLVELAQLGNELCGGYYLRQITGFGKHEQNKSLTTKAQLEDFVERVPKARGAKKALHALRWITNHCNSPMETNVLLMLCLPTRMGGWQLPIPKVNSSKKVGSRLARYVGSTEYTPDFLWEIKGNGKTIRVTAEYDSSEHHDEDNDAQHTRIRRNDMKAMGYLVTSINAKQVAEARLFQYPARQIARDLGIYRRALSDNSLGKQNDLISQLQRERFR